MQPTKTIIKEIININEVERFDAVWKTYFANISVTTISTIIYDFHFPPNKNWISLGWHCTVCLSLLLRLIKPLD